MELQTMLIICVVLFALQALLCFKVKSAVLRLIPAALLLIALIIFAVLMHTSSGWDAPVFAIFAIVSGIFLISCGAGWAVWGICLLIRKKKA